MEQVNIFEVIHQEFKFKKNERVKLFEAFAGIGCQRMGLERSGVEHEVVGISEIDKYAIKSYEAIHGKVNNFGDIKEIKGKDLPAIDLFTYSFPCTDLSKAGQQKGMNKETRSGLVYEVLRILNELNEENRLPKVLIMENVVDLVQQKFVRQFNQIQHEIEELGYKNYTQTLNSKNYGVAQNRDRVFMISILGDYYYKFPDPIPLGKRLKDYLESDVDDKYFLSKSMLDYCTDMTDRNGLVRGLRFNPHDVEQSKFAFAITTNPGNRVFDNFIKIPEKTKKGYAKAHEGDGVYINRPHQKRGVVQKGMIQTLKTSVEDVGVVVNAKGVYLFDSERFKKEPLEEMSRCLKASKHDAGVIENELSIRKLTPLECWRLMGIEDEKFIKAQKVCSNAQLYKQAGNGIVVDVFASIVSKLV